MAFLLIAILPLASAVKPSVASTTGGLEIDFLFTEYLKAGAEYDFNVHVSNATAVQTNTTTSCFLHLYTLTGHHQLKSNFAWSSSDKEFALLVDGGNFTELGTHDFLIQCNNTGKQIGTITGQYIVTNSGIELTTGKAFVDIGLLLMLIIFLIGCVVLFMEIDHLLAKVGFLGLGYLLLIAINFIAWNMASDFLLSAPFVAEMFRILFFVLIIGLFPLLIGSFAWYFIMLSKIKEIENMMKHGMTEYDANERVNRRNK